MLGTAWLTAYRALFTKSRIPLGLRLVTHVSTFGVNEKLPRQVDVVVDSIGQATWEHSLQSVRAGGAVLAPNSYQQFLYVPVARPQI